MVNEKEQLPENDIYYGIWRLLDYRKIKITPDRKVAKEEGRRSPALPRKDVPHLEVSHYLSEDGTKVLIECPEGCGITGWG